MWGKFYIKRPYRCLWGLFWYPKDYLFSNQFMEDLGRIYSLRKYFPSFDDMEKTEG